MVRRRKSGRTRRCGLGVICWLCLSWSANAQFVEDVAIIHAWVGESDGDQFGHWVRVVGDVDSDGVIDIGVTTPLSDAGGTNAGRAYIFSGASGTLIRRHTGEPLATHGHDINGVGDVDGDGVSDYITGAPGNYFHQGVGNGPGRAYLYSGATGATIHVFQGEADGDSFGDAVSGGGNVLQKGVGDISGDGVPDIIVSAPHHGTAGVHAGRVYVFSGANLSETIHVLDGEGAGDLFGTALGGLGDVDKDGFGDFVVGAADAGPEQRGRSYVFSGRTGGLLLPPLEPSPTGENLTTFFATGPGDVDKDGTLDIYVADIRDQIHGVATGQAFVFSGADGSIIRQFTGENGGDTFGIGRGCGDVDFDGYPDFFIAANTYTGGTFAGKGYVFSGGDGSIIRSMTSNAPAQLLGFSVTGLGDINGDGALDFAMTATLNDDGGTDAGKVYIIAGNIFPNIGDLDNDGDVDASDQSSFEACFTGQGVEAAETCLSADTDDDGDVDCDDWRVFKTHWSGPPASPALFATCDVDCNANGIADDYEVFAQLAPDCTDNGVPDACDIEADPSLDQDGDGLADRCCLPSAAALPQALMVDAGQGGAPRFISFTAGDAGRNQAVRVTFDNEFPNAMPAPYEAWRGVEMWVGPPVRYCENSGQSVATGTVSPHFGCGAAPGLEQRWYMASTLQCDPWFQDWHGVCIDETCVGGMRAGLSCAANPDCAGPVYVYHEGIVPSVGQHNQAGLMPTTYTVHVIGEVCRRDDPANYSDPLRLVTSKWGDVVLDTASAPYGPPEGIVQIVDVIALLEKFQNTETASVSARVDLIGGNEPKYLPDHLIDIGDIVTALSSFEGDRYPTSEITGVPSPVPCSP